MNTSMQAPAPEFRSDPSRGLRGTQEGMINYLSGMLGKGLSVNGLRVLSESLAAAEGEDTKRYGIDTGYDMNVNDNSMKGYMADRAAASQDYETLSKNSIESITSNPFWGGSRGSNGMSFSNGNASTSGYNMSGTPGGASTNYMGNYNGVSDSWNRRSSRGSGGDGGYGGSSLRRYGM